MKKFLKRYYTLCETTNKLWAISHELNLMAPIMSFGLFETHMKNALAVFIIGCVEQSHWSHLIICGHFDKNKTDHKLSFLFVCMECWQPSRMVFTAIMINGMNFFSLFSNARVDYYFNLPIKKKNLGMLMNIHAPKYASRNNSWTLIVS